jgi:hypothetical protein
MLILTYLPAFITTVFRGMPGVWKHQHRLLLCWLIVLQAVYPGRKTLEELHRWGPKAMTAWRFRRVLRVCHHEITPRQPWSLSGLQHSLRLRVITNQVAHNVKVKIAVFLNLVDWRCLWRATL